MTAINLNVTADSPIAIESPVKLVEGESITFSLTFWDSVTSVSCLVYRNNTDVTSTVMPSGSTSVSGKVATLKPATALVGGARYVFSVTGTVAGNTRVRKFVAIVQKDEREA